MGRAALRGLQRLDGAEPWRSVLARGHLLLIPSRAAALKRMGRHAPALPRLPDALALSPRAQAALPRYVAALPLAPPVKTQKLTELKRLPDIRGRAHAITELVRGCTSSVNGAEFVQDKSESVARLAVDLLIDRLGGVPREAAERALTSRHASIVDAGRRALARAEIRSFREHWLLLPPLEQLASAASC